MRSPHRFIALAMLMGCLSLRGAVPAQAQQIDVWVDPGHGGTDKGTAPSDNNPLHSESLLALQQSSALVNSLLNLAYSAELTRNSDITMTKARRWKIANGTATNDLGIQATCQVFISIHMNADPSRNPATRGTETYYSPAKLRLKSKTAYRADSSFAAAVHPRLISNAAVTFIGCHENRNIKTELHTVTKRAEIPSLLIEVCFISNPCQLGHIVQSSKQAIIADGIAAGVSFYITPLGPAPASGRSPADPTWDGVSYRPGSKGQTGDWGRSAVQSSSEGFEGVTFPPAGWTMTTLGAPVPYQWHRTTDPLFLADGAAGALVRGQAPGAIDEWLITPKVFVSSVEHGLQFTWSGNQLFASAVNATAAVRPVGSETWTTIWSLLNEPPGGEWDYRQQALDLSSWIGDSVQVAFRVAGSNGADFMIDDVSFGSFTPTTSPPNDLCASAQSLPAGHFTINGSTCRAANNMAPPIAGACVSDEFTGPDVFYKFNAAAGDSLDLSVGGSWFPAAYVVSSCDSAVSSCVGSTPSLETADQTTGSTTVVLPSTGTYYVVVDGLEGECGPFSLSGFLRGPTTAVGPGDLAHNGLALTSFPNPGRRDVVLGGVLPNGGSEEGRLTVHDASGRLVASFRVEAQSGRFEIQWNRRDVQGTRLPAGMYFAKLTAGGRSVQRTVVLAE